MFLLLESEERILEERLRKKEEVLVGKEMESQFETTEVPGIEEGNVVPVDAGRERGEVLDEVLGVLGGL